MIFSNIFLFLISIFKILSSIYIPLIIISFCVLSIIIILSSRKITLPCNNCDNGSWWYKCKKNTGYGSLQCANLIEVVNKTNDLYDFIIDIPNKIHNISKACILHTYNAIIKWISFYTNIGILILKLNPSYFVYKFLVEPILGKILNIFKKLIKEIKKLDFGFTIPVIDLNINIGKLIAIPFELLFGIKKLILTSLISIFAEFATFIFDSIIKPIITLLINAYSFVFTKIIELLSLIFTPLTELISKINLNLNIINEIKLIHIINVGIQEFFKTIVRYIIFPIQHIPYLGSLAKFIIQNPYILFYIIFIPPIIMFFTYILGATLCIINLIKVLFYMIFSFDNDNDFYTYFMK